MYKSDTFSKCLIDYFMFMQGYEDLLVHVIGWLVW
jgi:hypothetical protein